jgi:catechol-2,3-dioxygenase
MPSATRTYETVLYADDLEAAARFYTEGFGLKLLSQNDLMLVLGIGENYVLIFDPQKSSIPGRDVPSHGTVGNGHIAFVAEAEELPAWRERLKQANIEIESEINWGKDASRGTSIYVRDPAGNSVELAPPILWSYLD